MPSLTLDQARERAALLAIDAMVVDLDLDQGEERFGSRTRIEFRCHRPGASTFVDLKAAQVHEVRLNGIPLDPGAVRDGRLELTDLTESNVFEAVATMAFTRDGQGLHRSVDPADGQHYVFGHFFLDAAPKVFACFDQPDLKAPYTVTVTAPPDWVVIANGDATREGNTWAFSTTKPLATYFVTVCAGPYVGVRDEHDGIPLGVYARASLGAELRAQADDILTVTKQSFDYYHELFGIRYPFAGYDQVFVPEFNAGAMENPGCVTFRDQYIFRGAVTGTEKLTRANTIAHEMAHMWFGDLVTMRWWDDLWLNESFAEYMAQRTLVAATDYRDAWVDFGLVRKLWGYAADAAPSTHPIAGAPAPDGDTALANFDGISYAKGASALRQLIAHIGDDHFIAGVSDYLREHAFGNGEFDQFLAAMERSSGQDLGDWARAWLRTPGTDVLALTATDDGGHELRCTAPADFPAQRPHTLDIAGFIGGRERFRAPLVVSGPRTPVTHEGLEQSLAEGIVLPNAGDLTWATVQLDAASLAALPRQLASVPDPVARVVAWVSVLRGIRRGEVDPRLAIDLFATAWPLETQESTLGRVAVEITGRVIPLFLPPGEREGATARVAGAAFRLLGAAEPGSGAALAAARVFARTTDDEDRLRTWADGQRLPEGLAGDNDFRWVVLRGLATHGYITAHELEEARLADDTLAGRLACLTARAALPDPGSKGWAWYELTTNRARSNYETLALAAGLWSTPDPESLRPYAVDYFAALPRMRTWLGEDAIGHLGIAAYPTVLVDDAMLEAAGAAARREDLAPALRRAFVDGEFSLREAATSRRRFG